MTVFRPSAGKLTTLMFVSKQVAVKWSNYTHVPFSFSFFFCFNVLVQWKRCNLAIACYLSILTTRPVTLQQEFPSPLRYPLTSCCGAVRGQQRHTDVHTLPHNGAHTPAFVHARILEHTDIHTLQRRGHHAGLGLNHRTPDISICVTTVRSYFIQR